MTVLSDLQAAFNGESNAQAKYAAFATKADAEGFAGIASLFRATSRAEQIHAANHARVIERLGAKAECTLEAASLGTTLENLATALAGEKYEVETMYPGFLPDAASDPAATRTFHFALEAEKTHVRLYEAAIAALKSGEDWIKSARAFAVCPICGYTVETIAPDARCPVCRVAGERFEVIR
jgi:rubrerythrin